MSRDRLRELARHDPSAKADLQRSGLVEGDRRNRSDQRPQRVETRTAWRELSSLGFTHRMNFHRK